jgi:hypothetical protein
VPWAAFLVTLALADGLSGDATYVVWDLLVPLAYVVWVGVPSAVALLVAKPGWMRAAVLVMMTTVAVISAVLLGTTDDAQAGLAVLWVPFTAAVLTALMFAWRIIDSYRSPPNWLPTRSSG